MELKYWQRSKYIELKEGNFYFPRTMMSTITARGTPLLVGRAMSYVVSPNQLQ